MLNPGAGSPGPGRQRFDQFKIDQIVVNAWGSTAASNGVSLLFSGGEPVIGQSYSNSFSAQVGFLNDYFQPAPTPTITHSPVPVPDHFFKIFHSQINPNHGERASIRWNQASAGPVTLAVYNLRGDKIITLADNKNYSGNQVQEATWDGRIPSGKTAGSGIYVVYLKTAAFEARGKIAVIK